jgi:hypothetical protein
VASLRFGLLLVLALIAPICASATGLPDNPSWIFDGGQRNAALGKTLAAAGDVNADGFDDILVAAPDYSDGPQQVGRVLLFLGASDGFSTTADWTLTGTQAFGHLGAAVSSAGDVDGDGHDDVLVATPYHSAREDGLGRVRLFRGGPGGLPGASAWILVGDQENEHLGVSVAGGGDVNGDGYDDILAAAPHHSTTLGGVGRVMLFLGSSNGLSTTADWELAGGQAGMSLGAAVGFAGDVNGDGYDDILIGAPVYDNGEANEGAAFLLYGSAGGVTTSTLWMSEGNQGLAIFGGAVAGAGDVDGDGFDDVLIGAWAHDRLETDQGRAYLYRGSTAGLSSTASWIGEVDQWRATFGWLRRPAHRCLPLRRWFRRRGRGVSLSR